MEENKNAWLKELKVGDKVVVWIHHYTNNTYTVDTVNKITPKGFIKVSGYLFEPKRGVARGDYSVELLNFNDEKVKSDLEKYNMERKRMRLVRMIYDTAYKLSYEQAVYIANYLGIN